MSKPTIADVMFGGLLVWAFAATAYVVHLEVRRKAAPSEARATPVASWRNLRTAGFAMGSRDAAKSVVVFSDFQCPYCRQFAAVVDSLRGEHPEVLVVERHLPLVDLHDAALDAALAAECAGDAGRYPEMRHVLFSYRQLVAEEEWGRLAHLAGVTDTAALIGCVTKRTHIEHVKADIAAAHRLGIEATPGVVVNDSLYIGAMSLPVLERRLQVDPADETRGSR